MAKLVELAKVLRSKNSGPYEITLDILFDNPESYHRVLQSGRLTKQSIAELYGLTEERMIEFVTFDAALGIKITYLREIASGTVGDRDVYGAQQHAPLMGIEIP
ncbi:MAG: DUF4387 domain-containing protein [Clostridia bacterium]